MLLQCKKMKQIRDVAIIFHQISEEFFPLIIENKECWEIEEAPHDKKEENRRRRRRVGGEGREGREEVEEEGEEEKEKSEYHCNLLLTNFANCLFLPTLYVLKDAITLYLT